MARAKQSVASRTRRKATLKAAKGYYGNKSRSFRAANEQVMHSGQYAFRDRRARKGEFRRLWIQRINAAARQNGTTYSRLMHGLATAGISVDRKNLADLAVTDSTAFAALAQRAEVALADGDSAAPEADASSDEPAGADASGDESADADASGDEPADASADESAEAAA